MELKKFSSNKTKKLINPFVHTLDLSSFYDTFKLVFMSIFVLPIRVILIIVCLCVAYVFASIGMIGRSKQGWTETPLSSWRKVVRSIVCKVVRWTYVNFGFYLVRVKGKATNSKEAPIIVAAPHSSMFDALPAAVLGPPSTVAKGELKFIDYTQPVYVWREDPNSRQTTISEIKRRANSEDDWPQIMIFPEGTCANRSCLITFKPGAFYPGVPVQPVIIRYPNNTDCMTWTWDGPGALKLLWVTLCQFQNHCEIEYLPVYEPNEEEIKNPFLFASNVRQVMADALGVPVVDYTYDDCRIMHKAKLKGYPCDVGLVEYQKLRRRFGTFSLQDVEGTLMDDFASFATPEGKLTLDGFAEYLNLKSFKTAVHQIFNSYKESDAECMSFRDFVVFRSELQSLTNSNEKFRSVFDHIRSRRDSASSAADFVRTLTSYLEDPNGNKPGKPSPDSISLLLEDVDPDEQDFAFDVIEKRIDRNGALARALFLYWKLFMSEATTKDPREYVSPNSKAPKKAL